jgi:hypothetical protein
MTKVFVPKELLANPQKLIRAVNNIVRNVAQDVKADFVATTLTWKRKPTFTIERVSETSTTVTTDNPIWIMLNAGTKPHIIRIKNAKFLAFRWDGRGSGKAKTKPGYLGSYKGSSPKTMNYRKSVKHPGTQARVWVATAEAKWEKLFPQVAQRAIDAEV